MSELNGTAFNVNFNAAAMNATNDFSAVGSEVSGAIQALSSGENVSSAADNPAAFTISQFLNYEIFGVGEGIANSQQAISILNIASGALSQISGLLDVMEQLATSSSNAGSMDSSSFNGNQTQYSALMSQINTITTNTTYGDVPLLGGTYASESFQVGAFTFNVITFSLPAVDSTALAISTTGVSNAVVASAAMDALLNAVSIMGSIQSGVGATQSELQDLANDLNTFETELSSTNSTIINTNMAQELTLFASDQILLQSSLSMIGQAQTSQSNIVKLIGQNVRAASVSQPGATSQAETGDMASASVGLPVPPQIASSSGSTVMSFVGVKSETAESDEGGVISLAL